MVAELANLLLLVVFTTIVQCAFYGLRRWYNSSTSQRVIARETQHPDKWNVVRECVQMMPAFSGKPTDIGLKEFLAIFESYTSRLGQEWEMAKLALLKSRLTGDASECVTATQTWDETVELLKSFFASDEAIERKVKLLANSLPVVRHQFDAENLQKWSNFAAQFKSWTVTLGARDQQRVLSEVLLKNQIKTGRNSQLTRNLWNNRHSIDSLQEYLKGEVKETRGAMIEHDQAQPVNKM